MALMSIDNRCEVCKAKPDEPCANTINPGQPLPGHTEHYARALAPGDTARRRKAKA
jgi:hypothetical protein